ncbi:DNRLRE domain-containing protein [Nonomuraea sp. CA-143628]|uniref:DNRLRE domain-containing protein n=1 Tax=Nonomuraea sp. CA-143628 TaxID=3239997 RepID=UPI003D94E678
MLTALPMGYRQEIVLRAKPAKPIEINLPVKAKGLKFQTRRDGRVELADASGHQVARPFSASLFTGSADGRRALATKSKPGRANPTLKTADDGQSLIVGVDNSLLQDPTITYPLTIAATVTTSNADADVADDGAAADPTRQILTAGTIFGVPNRVYLSFDTKGLIGKKVVDAKLSLLNTDAPACGDPVGDGIQVRRVTSRWDANNLTWANKPSSADEGAQTVTKAYASDCGPDQLEWPVTDIMQSWTLGGNFGLELRAANETGPDDNWRSLASAEYGGPDTTPKLTATFESFGKPTIVYPAGADGVEVFTAPDLWRRGMPIAEAQAHALDVADTRVEAGSDALAPPLVDMVTGEVVTPAVTTGGRDAASQPLIGTAYLSNGGAEWSYDSGYDGADETDEDGDGVQGVTEPFTLNSRVPMVSNSSARLKTIASEILTLDGQIPGADKLIESSIWAARNQVMVQASEVTPELRLGLAQRYGATTVSIWLRPGLEHPTRLIAGPHDPDPDVRTFKCSNDSKGKELDCRLKDGIVNNSRWSLGFDFYINGGSRFRTPTGGSCSTGFAWGTKTDNFYLTAGHCLPTNLPAAQAARLTDYGFVAGDRILGDQAGTTYTDGKGSVIRPAPQGGFHGDLARIKLTARTQTASIFTSDNKSDSEKTPVAGKWSRSPRENDEYCTGGYRTGQECGWVVNDPTATAEYQAAPGSPVEQVVPVVSGGRIGTCTWPGDSGGPVYTIIGSGPAQGYITAKGIISGGTDKESGICTQYFTDIRLATKAFGGDIKKRKIT